MASKAELQYEIEKLAAAALPMHMPGHKRKLRPSDCLPYDWDITEISGADDLHDADGILKEAMDRASSLWGSRRTWFLVGGSTCGILAAVRAAAPFGSEIIAARNCHRSVYHAIELGGYKVHWIVPAQNRRFGFSGQITPDSVRTMLRRHPRSAAVVLTSPTYEGIVSDIRSIADLCHSAGIPLVVDEAHGAHLGLFKEGGFPDGAVKLGADAVVQSVHKTLPSLTQTALLHLCGDLISERELERQLGIFETSSPSYPLMISIDSCVHLLREEGPALFAAWKENLDAFYRRAEGLERIQVFGAGAWEDRTKEAPARDRCKILISFRPLSMSGAEAAQVLRERYRIEPEMTSGSCVLAMTGCGDSSADLERLYEALRDMERQCVAGGKPGQREAAGDMTGRGCGARTNDSTARRGDRRGSTAGTGRTEDRGPVRTPAVRTAMRILEAAGADAEDVPLDEAEGRICGEYVYAYPPGIPILAPGEYIERDHIEIIRQAEADGNAIHHTHASDAQAIRCLAE